MVTNIAADVQAFTSNAFLVDGERTVLVDPGANFDSVGAVEERADGLDAVLVTHPHPDHVGNLGDVKEGFGVDAWGFDASVDGVDHELADGDTVLVGNREYRVLHTPGHEPHHLCFYSEEAGVLFAADLVFANGSFGRTDLEDGDRATLVESIQYVLDVVDDELDVMHAGHGPSVTDGAIENIEFAAQAARRR